MNKKKLINPEDFSPSLKDCIFSEFGHQDTRIMIARLPISWGMEMLNSANQADASFVESNEEGKNLLGTSITSWTIHKEPWCQPHAARLMSFMSIGMREMISARTAYQLHLYDCWIVKYKNNSQLLPHNHGMFQALWSFVWYLDVPDEGTEIMYRVGDINLSKTVYSGDLLLFPSDVMHWSDDLHENRTVMAGNFVLSVFPKEGI